VQANKSQCLFLISSPLSTASLLPSWNSSFPQSPFSFPGKLSSAFSEDGLKLLEGHGRSGDVHLLDWDRAHLPFSSSRPLSTGDPFSELIPHLREFKKSLSELQTEVQSFPENFPPPVANCKLKRAFFNLQPPTKFLPYLRIPYFVQNVKERIAQSTKGMYADLF